MNRCAIAAIRLYQLVLSPYLGGRCRFYPSCSHYAVECFKKFNFFRAFYYTLKRVVKCSPFNSGGYDPVEK